MGGTGGQRSDSGRSELAAAPSRIVPRSESDDSAMEQRAERADAYCQKLYRTLLSVVVLELSNCQCSTNVMCWQFLAFFLRAHGNCMA